ncbi:type IX secretion system membrane protein PorP/SprF [Flavobacterium jejuense]|uniref:Type IX secretion system membrane protein PorP/SprF n=1 Tax=Flavobacterium jejuense TaxID=1544455 RepID=A0ABX0ISW6_9FLAO|nr:type IX secretion system membrane protein PorP/SprF [Flavobacterium jejuense]NHN26867.1 type IX secretion system membrane protein PorP/SprF [Flavobacterium jejuense]
MKKLNYIYGLILLAFCTSFAQQDPQFTQYMYNMSVVNPGYATDDLGVINFGGIYRAQWIGATGAPTTSSLFVHAPLSEKLESGFNIVKDELGDDVLNETTLTADLAYKVSLSQKAKLSIGLKAGVNFFNTNFNGFRLNDDAIGTDNAFQNLNETFLNVGAGAFFFTENYYLGLSVPNFLPNKQLKEASGINAIGVDELHFFFTGGYVFNLSDNIKFKPAFITKLVQNAPLSADITANFMFFDKFEIGAAHRFDDSFSGLVNYKITPQLRIGYAYDHTINNLGQFNSGSHEIIVLFNLDTFGNRGYDKSPRFF